MESGYCTKCSKRDQCVELCEEVENFVNSEHVSQQDIVSDERTLEYFALFNTLEDLEGRELMSSLSEEDLAKFQWKYALSDKQMEVLILIGDGHSQREVGRMLGVSEMAIRKRLTLIYEELVKLF